MCIAILDISDKKTFTKLLNELYVQLCFCLLGSAGMSGMSMHLTKVPFCACSIWTTQKLKCGGQPPLLTDTQTETHMDWKQVHFCTCWQNNQNVFSCVAVGPADIWNNLHFCRVEEITRKEKSKSDWSTKVIRATYSNNRTITDYVNLYTFEQYLFHIMYMK